MVATGAIMGVKIPSPRAGRDCADAVAAESRTQRATHKIALPQKTFLELAPLIQLASYSSESDQRRAKIRNQEELTEEA